MFGPLRACAEGNESWQRCRRRQSEDGAGLVLLPWIGQQFGKAVLGMTADAGFSAGVGSPSCNGGIPDSMRPRASYFGDIPASMRLTSSRARNSKIRTWSPSGCWRQKTPYSLFFQVCRCPTGHVTFTRICSILRSNTKLRGHTPFAISSTRARA